MIKWLKTLNDRISKVEDGLLVVMVLVMITLSFTQVVLRNFFSGGFTWADAMLRNLVLWVGFIGASLATRTNRHISIDALTKFLSPRYKVLAELFTSLGAIFIGIIFIYASVRFVIFEYESEAIAFLGIPFWVIQLIMPGGFMIITLRFLLKFIEDIQYFTGPNGRA